MKMRTKIITGFSMIILMLCIIGGIAVLIINESSKGFVLYRHLAKDSILIGRLQAHMLMMRMKVKDFIINNSENDVEAYQEYLELMEGFLQEAKNDIENQERVANINEIEQKVSVYKETFKKVTQLQETRNNLVKNTLDANGPVMEKDLTSILVSAHKDRNVNAAYYSAIVLRQLLLARLYMTKFLDTNGKENEQRVLTEMDALKESLRDLDGVLQNAGRRNLFNEVNAKVVIYESAFKELATTVYQRNDLITNTLDVIGPHVADLVEEVKLSVKEEQDTIGPKLEAQNTVAIWGIMIIGVIAFLLGLILAIITTSSILRQLGEDPALIDHIANKVALGDLKIKFTGEQEKLQGVYKSVKQMIDSLKEKSKLLNEIANGDLSVTVNKKSSEDELGESLLQMCDSLNQLLAQVNNAIDQVASGSNQVAQSSQVLSQGAAEQASSLEEISSSINEIASQARQNAENAKAANSLARNAMEGAEGGNERMRELVDSMQKINNSSEQINKIVKVIDDIAFQINLLALNANVEAARAGKYGKGFAVVADEVRSLAVKSATSVKDTTAMVEEAIKNITVGNKAAQATAEQLNDILTGVSKVAELVEEITAASNEQAQGIDQINSGLEQIDQVTQTNTANAEESASASEELASQAQQLKAMIARFKLASRESGDNTVQNSSGESLKRLIEAEIKKVQGQETEMIESH